MSKKETTPFNFIPRTKSFILKAEKKTRGGIYLPDNAAHIQDAMMNYPQEVIAASPDSEFKTGDYVLIDIHVLTPVSIEGEDYFIIPDFRALGKVLNHTKDKEELIKNKIASDKEEELKSEKSKSILVNKKPNIIS